MKYVIGYVQILLCSAVFADPGSHRSASETLAAFIGDWDMELVADKETFGDRGGAGSGAMSCEWGPMKAWVDCDMNSDYEGFGSYSLKIVLYSTGASDEYGAFVTNTFGGGRMYVGTWESEDKLVYRDAWIDPARKWEHQRTTYTFAEGGELSYNIEVSKNGVDYLPHSRGVYRRK